MEVSRIKIGNSTILQPISSCDSWTPRPSCSTSTSRPVPWWSTGTGPPSGTSTTLATTCPRRGTRWTSALPVGRTSSTSRYDHHHSFKILWIKPQIQSSRYFSGSHRSTAGRNGSVRLQTDPIPRRILRVAPRLGIPKGQRMYSWPPGSFDKVNIHLLVHS